MKQPQAHVLLVSCCLMLSACNPVAGPADPGKAAPPEPAPMASAPAPAVQSTPVEPELARQVNDEIDRQGAKATVSKLFNDDARFDKVGDAIATADPVWLTIALRLRPGSDAGSSTILSYSLAEALPNAPERVLALVGHGYSIDALCTTPFIEPAPGVAEAYEAKAIAALQSVTDPALKATVEECIKGVTLP